MESMETFALGYAAGMLVSLAFAIKARAFGWVLFAKIMPLFGGILCFVLLLKRMGAI